MKNNFDFLVGTWTSEHHRRPAFTDDPWDEFPGFTKCWSVFDGAGNVDEIVFPTKDFGGLTVRLYDAAKDEPVDGELPGVWVDAWRVAVLEQRAVTKRIVADHAPRRSTSCAAAPLPFSQHRGARPRAGGLPRQSAF